jgi:hypothetical protein
LIPCIGCGALVPDIDGPAFRYPESGSPGCWAIYTEILARQYQGFDDATSHKLSVDAYAVQHPGRRTPQTVQSVNVHLISLSLFLERGYDSARSNQMMDQAIRRFKGQFSWLEPPASRGALTVLDVVWAGDAEDHQPRVRRWAESAWEAWSPHHAAIHAWVHKLEEEKR